MNLKLSHQDRMTLVELIDKKLELERSLELPEAINLTTLRKQLIERPNCPNECCVERHLGD